MSELLWEKLPQRLARWGRQFEGAGVAFGLDPLLLAAICGRESNGDPDILGDSGHGHGLMQIDDRYHSTFCGATGCDGGLLWRKPAFNVLYGAEIIAHNLSVFGGDLLPAIAAYNASPSRVLSVRRSLAPGLDAKAQAHAYDQVTTGSDYVTDVLRRQSGFGVARTSSLDTGARIA